MKFDLETAFKTCVLAQNEPIAQEVAREFGASLNDLRNRLINEKRELDRDVQRQLDTIIRVANIIRYYKLGRDPARWFKPDDEYIRLAREILGLRSPQQRLLDLEQQKEQLREKGFIH
jgi:hypothetical protein